MNYFYAASIGVLLFWLLLSAIGYTWLGALLLALIGGIAGAVVFVWWQEPHQFRPAKLRPMFTDEKGQETRRVSSYENIAMARQRQSTKRRRRDGLASRLLRQRSR